MSKLWSVKVPFAGHMIVDVRADSEVEAIAKAMDEATIDHVEGWETVAQFNEGNVCYCPQPWEAEATLGDDDE